MAAQVPARYGAPQTYPAPSPASQAVPKAAPSQTVIMNTQQAAQHLVDAYANAALKGIEEVLDAEHDACSKVDIKGRGLAFKALRKNGMDLSVRVFVIEEKHVKPLNVDTQISSLNEPTKQVFNLIFRACVTQLPQRHNFGLVLHGLEQGVRPERTPRTLAEFNMANPQMLKTYVYATVAKMKPDHGNIILSAGLKV